MVTVNTLDVPDLMEYDRAVPCDPIVLPAIPLEKPRYWNNDCIVLVVPLNTINPAELNGSVISTLFPAFTIAIFLNDSFDAKLLFN